MNVIHVSALYRRADVILESDLDMMWTIAPSTKKPMEYAEAAWSKALRCNRIIDEYVLRDIFVTKLPESICHSSSSCWVCKGDPIIHDLAPHIISMAKLQHGSDSFNLDLNNVNMNSRNGKNDGKRSRHIDHFAPIAWSFTLSNLSRDSCYPLLHSIMQLEHRQYRGTPQSLSPSSSSSSIDKAAFFRFHFMSNNVTTQCPSVMP